MMEFIHENVENETLTGEDEYLGFGEAEVGQFC